MVLESVLFHGKQDDRHRLNVAANVLIGILLFMLINKATSIMVAEFSQAHSR
jgi:ABC-type polysaccharide/polyol phosphate export permease